MVIVAPGVIKKLVIMVFILSFLLMHFSTPVKASLAIIPGKLTITMPEGFPKETITYYIYAKNPYSYGVNGSARIENPPVERLPEGYTQIPDLSWVTVKPDKVFIPPGETGKFEILIDIPEDQKPSQYNKKWETWATITNDQPGDGIENGASIKVELTVRLLINTPSSDKAIVVQPSYVVIILITAVIVSFIVIFYSKKNRKNQKQKL
jgi:hypothetical protein